MVTPRQGLEANPGIHGRGLSTLASYKRMKLIREAGIVCQQATFDLTATWGKVRIDASWTTGDTLWSQRDPLAARAWGVAEGWTARCEAPTVSGTEVELRDAREAMGYVDPS